MRGEASALLVAAGLLFTANAARQSLPSLDDCFYARKGVEMSRAGRVFTVTWNERPTFQNPPLQIFLLARSFSLFGEGDLAARLPSIVMALGLLAVVFWIGSLESQAVGATAVALLGLTPLFANHARRCMMEVPLALWVGLFFSLVLAAERRPRLLALLGLPLGAGLLTKSVLGLLPLIVLATTAAVDKPMRRALLSPWLWAGCVIGLGLGAAWPLQQYLVHGPEVLREHYLREIAARSTASLGALQFFAGYPLALLGSYQPVILPALFGIGSAWRSAGSLGRLLACWFVTPILVYSLSSARSPRYLFPALPAMALVSALWLCRRFPRFALWIRRLAVVLLLAAAAAFWVTPYLLARPGNDGLKQEAAALRAAIPPGQPIAYLGTRYWGIANPLLYYAELSLQPSSASPQEALAGGLSHPSRVLVVDRDRLAEVEALAPSDRVFESSDWLLLRVSHPDDRRR